MNSIIEHQIFLESIDLDSIKHIVKRDGSVTWFVWRLREYFERYDLTRDDINYLRAYYKDPSICRIKNNRVHYTIAEDRNKYNYKSHTKKKVSNVGIKFIVGALVVTICYATLAKDIGVNKVNAKENETPIEITLPSEGNEGITMSDVVNSRVENYGERANTIKDYCEVYQLNFDLVYQRLCELTNNFTDGNYLNGYIPGITCKGAEVHANSEKELLLYTIRCMKQIPSRVGIVDTSGLYINDGYNPGTNYYQMVEETANTLGIDKCLLYAVINSESSFDSQLFHSNHNPGGLRDPDGNGWWMFNNIREGIYETAMEIVKYYRLIGKDPMDTSYNTLVEIRDIHAPLSDGNAYWLDNVTSSLSYAQSHIDELFGSSKGMGK